MKKLNNNLSNISVGKNFMYKVLSFALAVGLWLLVTNNLNPEYEKTFRSVEINYENFSAFNSEYEIMNQVDKKLDVTITGKRNDIIKLKGDSIYAYVDFSAVNDEQKSLPIKVKLASTKVVVSDMSTEFINVVIDKKLSKVFPIQIHQIGKLQGEVWPEFETEKKSVVVTGPSSEISKVKEIAAIVDLSDVEDGKVANYTLEIIPKGSEVGEIKLDMSAKNVGIKTVLYTKKKLQVIPKFIGEPEGDIELVTHKLSRDTALVSAPLVKLSKVNYIYTEKIDLSNVNEVGSKTENTKLALAPLFKVDNKDLTIILDFDEKMTKTLVFDVKNVEVLNAPKSMKVFILEPEKIEFEILGYSKVVEKLESSDMKVDLAIPSAFTGEKDLFYNASFKIPTGGLQISASTDKLKVRLENLDE